MTADDGIWKTQGRNLEARWEGNKYGTDDIEGEEVPTALGQEWKKRYPDRPLSAQQAPMPPPSLEMKKRLYPDAYNEDQLTFQDAVPSGSQNHDFWEQWGQPAFDPKKQRHSESSNPTASDLFEHPTMFENTPALGTSRTVANYTFGGPQDYSGSFIDMGNSGIIHAQGSLGGVTTPQSMESVFLHEQGHNAQKVYGLPRGGNPDEGGMFDRGTEARDAARQRLAELESKYTNDTNQLVAMGIQPDAAAKMVERLYPNVPQWQQKYATIAEGLPLRGVQPGTTMPLEYTGYRAEGGEAQSKNLQHRAANLSNRIPMTGETRMSEDFAKPLEGDVHPFDTMEIPPDLTRLRYRDPSGGEREVKPRLGEYDWLLHPQGRSPPLGRLYVKAGPCALRGRLGSRQARHAAQPLPDRRGTVQGPASQHWHAPAQCRRELPWLGR
jgi:hypothetical protein